MPSYPTHFQAMCVFEIYLISFAFLILLFEILSLIEITLCLCAYLRICIKKYIQLTDFGLFKIIVLKLLTVKAGNGIEKKC